MKVHSTTDYYCDGLGSVTPYGEVPKAGDYSKTVISKEEKDTGAKIYRVAHTHKITQQLLNDLGASTSRDQIERLQNVMEIVNSIKNDIGEYERLKESLKQLPGNSDRKSPISDEELQIIVLSKEIEREKTLLLVAEAALKKSARNLLLKGNFRLDGSMP